MPGFQPLIPPSSPAKINTDAAGVFPSSLTLNPVDVLNNCPVGAESWPPAPGMFTTNACLLPLPSYSVAMLLPLSEIQKGVVGPYEIPQAFLKVRSGGFAVRPGISETRS